MTQEQKVKPILKESYLKLIENSVGANVWRNFYAVVNEKKQDILKDGELSCAFFVSSVLVAFGLLKRRHMTVKSTIKDMTENGWQEIKSPKKGCILLWKAIKFPSGSTNAHLGFYIGNKKAISNRWEKKSPQIHHFTYGTKKDGSPKRKIEKIFWHKKLD